MNTLETLLDIRARLAFVPVSADDRERHYDARELLDRLISQFDSMVAEEPLKRAANKIR